MNRREDPNWMRLDNAAKLFPSTSSSRDTRVFRFVCELKETVRPELLQQALEETVEDFPHFRSVMRKGMFWYYLEIKDLPLVVQEESGPPCSALFYHNRETYLFRVLWYRKRINLEIFHALTDGTGAIAFLKTLICRYLILAHASEWNGRIPALPVSPAPFNQRDDGFQRWYRKPGRQDFVKTRSYQLRFLKSWPEKLKVIIGKISVSDALEQAHRYHATLTSWISALLLQAISNTMPTQGSRYPVTLMIPVNLRSYFPSETTRNFFVVIPVSYHFRGEDKLEDVIASVQETFNKELTQERLAARMSVYASLEHNAMLRILPLPLKSIGIGIGNRLAEWENTAVLSNIGKVSIPKEFEPYVNQFDFFTSTPKLQLCVCSYQSYLSLTFTSPFASADVERAFFQLLIREGFQVSLHSNQFPQKDEEPIAEYTSLFKNKRHKNRKGGTAGYDAL